MTGSRVFALPNPWAFHDWEGPLELRRQRLGPEAVKIPAGGPLLIAAPHGARLSISGRRRGLEPETPPFQLGDGSYALSIASVGTRPEENRVVVSESGASVGTVELSGHLPRPGWTGGRQGGAPDSARGSALDRFIELAVERIRAVESRSAGQSAWGHLAAAWIDNVGLTSEPPLALIVRHAERMRAIIADIAAHPRRLLRRRAEMVRVQRVQQLDASCIRWLSRQPGRTVFEQAGPRQRIRAIAREETIDTLENQVLRDFAERSSDVARRYLQRYAHLSASIRCRLVKGYGEECARIAHDLTELGVSCARRPIVPNYALLQERRYQTLWRAYRELLKNLDDQDESWRWQHRLWADFCRLSVHLSLRRIAGPRGTVAETPLRVAPEQQRGRWSQLAAQTGVFLIEHHQRSFVLSLVADLSVPHPIVPVWIASLGAIAAAHVQALDTNREAFLLVWPMHEVGEHSSALVDLAASAERALNDCLRDRKRHHDEDVAAGGVVLSSVVEPWSDQPQGPAVHGRAPVFALSFGPEVPALAKGVHWIGQVLLALADRLTR